ncbi:MAG: methylated-DNA--[protein]-cysteine S-methyltransferase [Alphaproteobacteria bacterium]|nr:methylated-DNA--[protein]-cysteine S-methyltransferase [Alphaproteobacteria bacterium]
MSMVIKTPLGDLVAIGDDEALYFLGFMDQRHLNREVSKLICKTKRTIKDGNAQSLVSIRSELESYFQGNLQQFKTPLMFLGTAFQNAVWTELKRTPYANTRSYLEESTAIGRPKSYRAVANANGANPFVIVVPCHRIIAADGTLGGYGGGLERKEWLLAHEGKIELLNVSVL